MLTAGRSSFTSGSGSSSSGSSSTTGFASFSSPPSASSSVFGGGGGLSSSKTIGSSSSSSRFLMKDSRRMSRDSTSWASTVGTYSLVFVRMNSMVLSMKLFSRSVHRSGNQRSGYRTAMIRLVRLPSKPHPLSSWKGSISTIPQRDTVAGEATRKSCTSKQKVMWSGILIRSPLTRQSILLSSSTVFMFSIHTASTGPSNVIHVRARVPSPRAVVRAMLERMPSVHSCVVSFTSPYSSPIVTDLGFMR
mmetsp:Transcript_145720/g.254335  ORF Transcript_145720/g.254335 Transcript_145720/m.254335 type:complete len:248 (+) Transcript_145720:7857-8600(+)